MKSRCRSRGSTLIEFMIAIAVSLLLLLGLSVLFLANSRNFSELERASRQVENGRYATSLLAEAIRHAGFFGEVADITNLTLTPPIPLPGAIPDPCATDVNLVRSAMPVVIQGVDAPDVVPACLPDYVPGTDVLVVRRSSTITTSAANAVANGYYTQVSFCAKQLPVFKMDQTGFTLQQKDCATPTPIRQYRVEIYFVSPCSIPTGANGQCQNADKPVPTLKRLELRPANDPTCPVFASASWCLVPLVEGIENLQIEYGIDTSATPDGAPDAYKTNPTTTAEWASVMAVRLHVLARNIDTSAGFSDVKTYSLGVDRQGNPYTITPNDAYHRHAYTQVVRLTNASQRKERPLCRAPTTDCS